MIEIALVVMYTSSGRLVAFLAQRTDGDTARLCLGSDLGHLFVRRKARIERRYDASAVHVCADEDELLPPVAPLACRDTNEKMK